MKDFIQIYSAHTLDFIHTWTVPKYCVPQKFLYLGVSQGRWEDSSLPKSMKFEKKMLAGEKFNLTS